MALSSKSKTRALRALTALVLVLIMAYGCQESPKKESSDQAVTDSANCVKPVNPNGESELALLMRRMRDHAEELKKVVEGGGKPGIFPEEFKKIHTATPTDAETKQASFDRFADHYLSTLQSLYDPSTQPKEMTGKFNALVNSCIGCHSEHCPGPLKAINKLLIE